MTCSGKLGEDQTTKVAAGWLGGGFILGAVVLAAVLALLVATERITVNCNAGKSVLCTVSLCINTSCSDINITETLCDTITSRQFVSVSSDLNPSVYLHEVSGSNTEQFKLKEKEINTH